MPAVSVIVPAYNQGHYLGEAVRSVLAQTYLDFEVIIVDDGSTDSTRRVAHSFNDPRLRYHYQENRGLSAARNTGIRLTDAPYVSFLDSDDQFLPEKLSLLVEVLDNQPEVGFVAGQALLIDEKGRRLGKAFTTPPPADGAQLLLGNPLHVGSVLLRRGWLERVGVFDERLRSYEDWDLWLRLARAGCRMGWVPRPVSLYRFHTGQMIRDGSRMTASTFAVLEKVYASPDLPESWQRLRDRAYSNAYLRAAAQAYHAQAFEQAIAALREATRLDPVLCADDGAALAARLAAWADDPRARDPLTYLETIYDHLPEDLQALRRRRASDLARAALRLAFDAHARGDRIAAGAAMRRAVRYQPGVLANRGALSIFLRSLLARRRS